MAGVVQLYLKQSFKLLFMAGVVPVLKSDAFLREGTAVARGGGGEYTFLSLKTHSQNFRDRGVWMSVPGHFLNSTLSCTIDIYSIRVKNIQTKNRTWISLQYHVNVIFHVNFLLYRNNPQLCY